MNEWKPALGAENPYPIIIDRVTRRSEEKMYNLEKIINKNTKKSKNNSENIHAFQVPSSNTLQYKQNKKKLCQWKKTIILEKKTDSCNASYNEKWKTGRTFVLQ